MQKLREEKKVMSVNQLSVYHVAMDMFNIINHASLCRESSRLNKGDMSLEALRREK